MKVYIAGKFSAWPRLIKERARLIAEGYDVSSSWMDTGLAREGEPSLSPDMAYNQKAANRDIREVIEANIFIIDTLDESYSGGREVELGTAAMHGNKYIFVVGPVRNIFHTIHSRFDTWDELLDALEGLGK